MKFTIKNDELIVLNGSKAPDFPKYTSQLINWANQNAQGTRPVVVGQMSELFPEFMATGQEITIENWHDWYVERYPDAFEKATEKIYAQVQNLRDAIPLIDREMVKHWVEDLVIAKTFNGMYVQKAILASPAERKGTTYRLATPEEESVGIDGYVGNVPYSVKPDTYKTMGRLSETIAVKMIFYIKTRTGLKVEVED
jgi:hypothetical protein